MSDDEIIKEAREAFERAADAEAENRREALDDLRFARLGEQWPAQIKRERDLDGRPCLTLNRLPAFIRQVVNDARQNKPGMVVHPVDSGADPATAEVFNGLIRHIEQNSDAEVACAQQIVAMLNGLPISLFAGQTTDGVAHTESKGTNSQVYAEASHDFAKPSGT